MIISHHKLVHTRASCVHAQKSDRMRAAIPALRTSRALFSTKIPRQGAWAALCADNAAIAPAVLVQDELVEDEQGWLHVMGGLVQDAGSLWGPQSTSKTG